MEATQALSEILKDKLYGDDLQAIIIISLSDIDIFELSTPSLFFPLQYIGTFTSAKASPSTILRA